MIYFLINNNFHLDLDIKLARQLNNYELGLIQVPYSLNVLTQSTIFTNIYNFPDKIYVSLSHPFKIFSIQKRVSKEISPTGNDILLVHTDRDLVNQYIIQLFHKVNAKIYLLEDGASTITSFNIEPVKATFKERIKCLIFRSIYNYKYLNIAKYGVETLMLMDDHLFTGLILNLGKSLNRNIPLYKLDQIQEPLNFYNENGAIFFNQDLYLFNSTEKEYLNFLHEILYFSEKFEPFYFKFHPSDTESAKIAITKLLRKINKKIIIIEDNIIGEEIIYKYPVKYSISVCSSINLNLINRNIIPIFLNKFYNERFPNPTFFAFEQFLKSINCHFPLLLSDVRPGFIAFPNEIENENTQSLVNILKLSK